MLCTMKPMIRNDPSASSLSANDEPMASPSPRLWRPIPMATSVASATPAMTSRSPAFASSFAVPRADSQRPIEVSAR